MDPNIGILRIYIGTAGLKFRSRQLKSVDLKWAQWRQELLRISNGGILPEFCRESRCSNEDIYCQLFIYEPIIINAGHRKRLYTFQT